MGQCLTGITCFLLCLGLLTQAVSFLTAHMDDNDITSQNRGIFFKCVAGKCFWFQFQHFPNEPVWNQAVLVLSVASIAVFALLLIFALINFIPRFSSPKLHVFLATLLILNAILIASVVTVYTTSNSESIRFTGGSIRYSWSYWLLYCTIAVNFLTSLFYCFNRPKTDEAKFN